MLIKFLQDAAGKGDLDPWDIDVISVIDSFLEQYSQSFGSKSNSKNSYHKNLNALKTPIKTNVFSGNKNNEILRAPTL